MFRSDLAENFEFCNALGCHRSDALLEKLRSPMRVPLSALVHASEKLASRYSENCFVCECGFETRSAVEVLVSP